MCFNAAFVPIIYLFYPETAGKTLEELDLQFNHTAKGYKLTEKGSRLGQGGDEEAQVFAALRKMSTAHGQGGVIDPEKMSGSSDAFEHEAKV